MASTYLATNIFNGDGVRTQWPFSFAGVSPDSASGTLPYLYPADVHALELYVDTAGNKATAIRTVVLSQPNVATILGDPVAVGRQLKIYRKTEIRYPLVDYRDRQSVSEFDLDLANRQAVFIAQETQDAATTNLIQDIHGNFDANGLRIVNIAAGVDPGDAVNMEQYNRTIRGPVPGPALTPLPGASERAGKLLVFDASGNPTAAFMNTETAVGLEIALADRTDPLKGAGKIGLDPLLSYPPGSFGSAVSDVSGRFFGILADGSNETAKLITAAAVLRNSGVVLTIPKGTLHIESSVDIEGFTVKLRPGAAIRVFGSAASTFINGGLRLKPAGRLEGGVVYTAGSMTAAFGSNFAARTCAVFVEGGQLYSKVYSQLYSAVKYTDGTLDCHVYGGVYGGVAMELSVDKSYTNRIQYTNVGVAYVDMIPTSYIIADCRAVYLRATIDIWNKVSLYVDGDLGTKNAVWLQGLGGIADGQLKQLFLSGNVTRAGYYMDADNIIQLGHGAGTCVEILNAPNAQISINTTEPQGYNVAIASGSNGAQISGLHRGNGGDPVVVVVNSHDVLVAGELTRGTVGVSVGEDGATSNNCRVSAKISDMSAAPVLFHTGTGLHVEGSVIDGEPTYTPYTGAWSGPGAIRAAVVVHESANEVVFVGNTVHGWFTHYVIDRSSITGRLRILESGNSGACPILSRNDISRQKFSRVTDGAKMLRMSATEDLTGHAFVGELSIPGSGPSFAAVPLAAQFNDMTDFIVGADTTLADIRKRYAVLVYIKYDPLALNKRVAFSLQTGGGTVHAPLIFYGTYGDPVDPVFNSIQGKLHKLAIGEWIPLVFTLESCIDPSSTPTNLTHMLVYKMDGPTTYDLVVTKPVMIYLGNQPK